MDFFSLDVEGHELKILKTIPWHKVGIKVNHLQRLHSEKYDTATVFFILFIYNSMKALTVEWDNMPEGQEALSRFMEESGFIRIGAFDFLYSRDVIFIKDLINN